MSILDSTTWGEIDQLQAEAAAIDGLIPKRIVYPASYEEAAGYLREANAAGQKVVIRGGGTKIGLGNPPEGLDLLVSTRRLNQILEYEPADLTLAVQAGTNLGMVQAELEKQGQFLPIESPLASRATAGGAIAANSTGPARLQYGAPRDWLIGVRFALADGTIAHAGGRVVKNVAGFDLMKIFTGSLGTLGLMLELNFKLLPLPKARATLVIGFENEDIGGQVALKLIDQGLFPVAETLLDAQAALSLGLPARPTLLVEVRNTVRAVERQVRQISETARESGATRVEHLTENQTQRELWEKITDFAYRPALSPENSFSLKVGVLPTQSATILKQVQKIAMTNAVEIEGLAHAGHGTLYLTGHYCQEEAALKTINELRDKVEPGGGWLVAERVPLSLKRCLNDIWGNSLNQGELRLMREIKHRLDPNRTLNPGRYVTKL
jgi:glycolate oxidase FAD binding subunit